MRILYAFFVLLFAVGPVKAETFDYTSFGQTPILHEGRVKPLDSFARIYFQRFSGKESFQNLSAKAWLAEVLFDPAFAAEREVFLVRSRALKTQLGLSQKEKYFSLLQVQEGLEKVMPQIRALFLAQPVSLEPDQQALLELYASAHDFMRLMRGFSLALPLNLSLPEIYAKGPQTYLELLKVQPELTEKLKALVKRKGSDIENYNEEEAKLARAVFNMEMFQFSGQNNDLLRILPKDGLRKKEWVSPWAILLEGSGSPQSKSYFDLWREMADAYRDKNYTAFNKASLKVFSDVQNIKEVSSFKLKMEALYNSVKPFHWALGLYALSGVLLLVLTFKQGVFSFGFSLSVYGFGVLAHGLGIFARIFLLERPPVGTLYESIIFVALICSISVFFSARRFQSRAILFSGVLMGAGLLAVAPALIVQGESMEMLAAVLNTNFWLFVHVLCITVGYAMSIMGAALAHAYLALRALGKEHAALLKIQKTLYRTCVAALLLMTVGTALGGLWADQSWGRFWGWDPKENGALLIVLWLIWILHGRISGKLSALSFAALGAYLNVIVALAWFGVNLLSVGLHSYGFIGGIAMSLGGFVGLETALIGALWFFICYKGRVGHAT